jgi:DNA-binding MarR family transcriptional regulator
MLTVLGLEDQVIVALRRITRAIDLHSRGLMQQVGLTAPQLAALQAIGRLQPITAGALAKSIHLSQATLTGILTRLETRALVSRTLSSSDRRTVVVELAEEGRAVLESAPSLLQDRFRRELLKLQEWERTQMLATLQRIAPCWMPRSLTRHQYWPPAPPPQLRKMFRNSWTRRSRPRQAPRFRRRMASAIRLCLLLSRTSLNQRNHSPAVSYFEDNRKANPLKHERLNGHARISHRRGLAKPTGAT